MSENGIIVKRIENMSDWLKNGIIGASVAENTPVMTAFGWKQDKDDNWQLSSNQKVII